jgi:hypothetical protein
MQAYLPVTYCAISTGGTPSAKVARMTPWVVPYSDGVAEMWYSHHRPAATTAFHAHVVPRGFATPLAGSWSARRRSLAYVPVTDTGM